MTTANPSPDKTDTDVIRKAKPHTLGYGKPLCASLDGFTLHGAHPGRGANPSGREALLRYVRRPPIAQEHLAPRAYGVLRITLKKLYADGTLAVDMGPVVALVPPGGSLPLRRASRADLRAWRGGQTGTRFLNFDDEGSAPV
jgi:hypothetical protein